MRYWNSGYMLALVLALTVSAANAQDPNYILSVGDIVGSPGSSHDVSVMLDSAAGGYVQGWFYGACTDPSHVAITNVTAGATTAGFDGGGGAAFHETNIYVDGWTVGLLVSWTGSEVLAPAADSELDVVTLNIVGPADTSSSIVICDVLGMPPVTSVVAVQGQSVPPATVAGTVLVQGGAGFVFTADNLTAGPTGSFSATCSIQDIEGDADDTQGFSMALSNDSDVIVPTATEAIGVISPADGGIDPAFFEGAIFADGWTLGVVYSFLGGVLLQFTDPELVVLAHYDIVSPQAGGVTTTLAWSDDLGMPPVANVVVVSGQSIHAAFADGTVTFGEAPDPPFLRGDCNTDGIVDIADGIWLISELFFGSPESACPAACDANGDGMVDSSDAITIWNYRFLEGPPPVAPFPSCDTSIAESDLALGCSDGGCF